LCRWKNRLKKIKGFYFELSEILLTFTPLKFEASSVKVASPIFVSGLKCMICGSSYDYGNVFTCPTCGIEGILDVQYDYDAILSSEFKSQFSHRSFNHWR